MKGPIVIDAASWDRLSDSAKEAILDSIAVLGDGFTGKLELECNDGGVKRIRAPLSWKPGTRRTA